MKAKLRNDFRDTKSLVEFQYYYLQHEMRQMLKKEMLSEKPDKNAHKKQQGCLDEIHLK